MAVAVPVVAAAAAGVAGIAVVVAATAVATTATKAADAFNGCKKAMCIQGSAYNEVSLLMGMYVDWLQWQVS